MITGTHTGSGSGWRKPLILSCDLLSLFLAGIFLALLFLSSFFFFSITFDSIPFLPRSKSSSICNCNLKNSQRLNLQYDPPESTFYDDPMFSYSIGKRIEDWDGKRRKWLDLHPSFGPGSEERVLIVTGSKSTPCKNPIGDHFLLRFYRNKVDYCRIHGYDIFYNNVLLHPEMPSCWAKLPAVRAAMLAHPEAEWIWWLDEDTAFTDMDFKLPLERYKDHNFVVHGWEKEVYEKKRWLGLNAGSFLIRNCQWSLDFLETWADMGPQSSNYDKWTKELLKIFKHESDDQTALAYLLVKEKEKQRKEMVIESGYYLEGYWIDIMDTIKNITMKYLEIEKEDFKLRRRHAEKVSETYAEFWEPILKDAGYGLGSWRRPFVTHFAGCQPCSGKHNPSFTGKSCWDAMNKALNIADNQVLRNYGFMRHDISDSDTVSPVPFDYPAS